MQKMYLNDEKTDMILICGEYNKNASGVAPLCRQNLRFFPSFRKRFF
jgi:hypothetical protein